MSIDAGSISIRRNGRDWLAGIDFGLTGLTVRKTGARLSYSPSVLSDVVASFRYFFAVRAMEPVGAPFTMTFAPERAQPWYLIWPAATAAGAVYTPDVSQADVVMHFEDATYSPNEPPAKLKPGARLINYTCHDVSKTRVAEVSGQAFGRALRIDPRVHEGLAVEKSETNGAHDGRIVNCPMQPLPGRTYQKLIDSRGADDDIVDDLRTVLVGGRAIVVFIKRRPLAHRFENHNCEVLLRMPHEIYSEAELAQISDFAHKLGLDWGGVDVLRDRASGEIHIVDANKTDMGPPIALPLNDKIRATRLLARAFRDHLAL